MIITRLLLFFNMTTRILKNTYKALIIFLLNSSSRRKYNKTPDQSHFYQFYSCGASDDS